MVPWLWSPVVGYGGRDEKEESKGSRRLGDREEVEGDFRG